jgi:hypothetical protein
MGAGAVFAVVPTLVVLLGSWYESASRDDVHRGRGGCLSKEKHAAPNYVRITKGHGACSQCEWRPVATEGAAADNLMCQTCWDADAEDVDSSRDDRQTMTANRDDDDSTYVCPRSPPTRGVLACAWGAAEPLRADEKYDVLPFACVPWPMSQRAQCVGGRSEGVLHVRQLKLACVSIRAVCETPKARVVFTIVGGI